MTGFWVAALWWLIIPGTIGFPRQRIPLLNVCFGVCCLLLNGLSYFIFQNHINHFSSICFISVLARYYLTKIIAQTHWHYLQNLFIPLMFLLFFLCEKLNDIYFLQVLFWLELFCTLMAWRIFRLEFQCLSWWWMPQAKTWIFTSLCH